nr:hypothetical protein [Tanacetum cinerariifolium]
MSKISQKPGNIEHNIGSLQQKPDQRAFFSRNQAKKPKCQKNQSLGSILANYQKSNQWKKEKSKVQGLILPIHQSYAPRTNIAKMENFYYIWTYKHGGPDLPFLETIYKGKRKDQVTKTTGTNCAITPKFTLAHNHPNEFSRQKPTLSEKAELSVIATVEKAQLDDKLTKEELMVLLISY